VACALDVVCRAKDVRVRQRDIYYLTLMQGVNL